MTRQKTEGERIRTQACILCGKQKFWDYMGVADNKSATEALYEQCGIESRKELVSNEEAQAAFKNLNQQYNDWLNPLEEQYAENLSRGY
jgi:hypothetical protein